MIELQDRRTILNQSLTFASFIVNVQDAIYNPANNPYRPGEMYVDGAEVTRYVSQEECDKWNEQERLEFEQQRDVVTTKELEFIDEVIVGLDESDINRYVDLLSDGLMRMTEKLSFQSLSFLLVFPTPWLSQENSFPPVEQAVRNLRGMGVSDSFVGGFSANGTDLKELVKHLFWLFRCNASLPVGYFTADDRGFVGSVCQYGNIHFQFYSEKDKVKVLEALMGIGFSVVQPNTCIERFSEERGDFDEIEGRKEEYDIK